MALPVILDDARAIAWAVQRNDCTPGLIEIVQEGVHAQQFSGGCMVRPVFPVLLAVESIVPVWGKELGNEEGIHHLCEVCAAAC